MTKLKTYRLVTTLHFVSKQKEKLAKEILSKQLSEVGIVYSEASRSLCVESFKKPKDNSEAGIKWVRI